MATQQKRAPEKVSNQLEAWLSDDRPKTLGSLIDVFGEGSFAIVFVLLMAVPALPLPTGGVTHCVRGDHDAARTRADRWPPHRLATRALAAPGAGRWDSRKVH